jgi:putative flippase GtrA
MRLPDLRDAMLLRFLFVGGALALLYATLASIATSYLPFPKALSSGGVWVLCIPIGFWCHRQFTFVTRRPHRFALWLYAGVQVLGIAIAALVSLLLARGSFWPDFAAHLFASALAALASYVINRRFVFPGQSVD